MDFSTFGKERAPSSERSPVGPERSPAVQKKKKKKSSGPKRSLSVDSKEKEESIWEISGVKMSKLCEDVLQNYNVEEGQVSYETEKSQLVSPTAGTTAEATGVFAYDNVSQDTSMYYASDSMTPTASIAAESPGKSRKVKKVKKVKKKKVDDSLHSESTSTLQSVVSPNTDLGDPFAGAVQGIDVAAADLGPVETNIDEGMDWNPSDQNGNGYPASDIVAQQTESLRPTVAFQATDLTLGTGIRYTTQDISDVLTPAPKADRKTKKVKKTKRKTGSRSDLTEITADIDLSTLQETEFGVTPMETEFGVSEETGIKPVQETLIDDPLMTIEPHPDAFLQGTLNQVENTEVTAGATIPSEGGNDVASPKKKTKKKKKKDSQSDITNETITMETEISVNETKVDLEPTAPDVENLAADIDVEKLQENASQEIQLHTEYGVGQEDESLLMRQSSVALPGDYTTVNEEPKKKVKKSKKSKSSSIGHLHQGTDVDAFQIVQQNGTEDVFHSDIMKQDQQDPNVGATEVIIDGLDDSRQEKKSKKKAKKTKQSKSRSMGNLHLETNIDSFQTIQQEETEEIVKPDMLNQSQPDANISGTEIVMEGMDGGAHKEMPKKKVKKTKKSKSRSMGNLHQETDIDAVLTAARNEATEKDLLRTDIIEQIQPEPNVNGMEIAGEGTAADAAKDSPKKKVKKTKNSKSRSMANLHQETDIDTFQTVQVKDGQGLELADMDTIEQSQLDFISVPAEEVFVEGALDDNSKEKRKKKVKKSKKVKSLSVGNLHEDIFSSSAQTFGLDGQEQTEGMEIEINDSQQAGILLDAADPLVGVACEDAHKDKPKKKVKKGKKAKSLGNLHEAANISTVQPFDMGEQNIEVPAANVTTEDISVPEEGKKKVKKVKKKKKSASMGNLAGDLSLQLIPIDTEEQFPPFSADSATLPSPKRKTKRVKTKASSVSNVGDLEMSAVDIDDTTNIAVAGELETSETPTKKVRKVKKKTTSPESDLPESLPITEKWEGSNSELPESNQTTLVVQSLEQDNFGHTPKKIKKVKKKKSSSVSNLLDQQQDDTADTLADDFTGGQQQLGMDISATILTDIDTPTKKVKKSKKKKFASMGNLTGADGFVSTEQTDITQDTAELHTHMNEGLPSPKKVKKIKKKKSASLGDEIEDQVAGEGLPVDSADAMKVENSDHYPQLGEQQDSTEMPVHILQIEDAQESGIPVDDLALSSSAKVKKAKKKKQKDNVEMNIGAPPAPMEIDIQQTSLEISGAVSIDEGKESTLDSTQESPSKRKKKVKKQKSEEPPEPPGDLVLADTPKGATKRKKSKSSTSIEIPSQPEVDAVVADMEPLPGPPERTSEEQDVSLIKTKGPKKKRSKSKSRGNEESPPPMDATSTCMEISEQHQELSPTEDSQIISDLPGISGTTEESILFQGDEGTDSPSKKSKVKKRKSDQPSVSHDESVSVQDQTEAQPEKKKKTKKVKKKSSSSNLAETENQGLAIYPTSPTDGYGPYDDSAFMDDLEVGQSNEQVLSNQPSPGDTNSISSFHEQNSYAIMPHDESDIHDISSISLPSGIAIGDDQSTEKPKKTKKVKSKKSKKSKPDSLSSIDQSGDTTGTTILNDGEVTVEYQEHPPMQNELEEVPHVPINEKYQLTIEAEGDTAPSDMQEENFIDMQIPIATLPDTIPSDENRPKKVKKSTKKKKSRLSSGDDSTSGQTIQTGSLEDLDMAIPASDVLPPTQGADYLTPEVPEYEMAQAIEGDLDVLIPISGSRPTEQIDVSTNQGEYNLVQEPLSPETDSIPDMPPPPLPDTMPPLSPVDSDLHSENLRPRSIDVQEEHFTSDTDSVPDMPPPPIPCSMPQDDISLDSDFPSYDPPPIPETVPDVEPEQTEREKQRISWITEPVSPSVIISDNKDSDISIEKDEQEESLPESSSHVSDSESSRPDIRISVVSDSSALAEPDDFDLSSSDSPSEEKGWNSLRPSTLPPDAEHNTSAPTLPSFDSNFLLPGDTKLYGKTDMDIGSYNIDLEEDLKLAEKSRTKSMDNLAVLKRELEQKDEVRPMKEKSKSTGCLLEGRLGKLGRRTLTQELLFEHTVTKEEITIIKKAPLKVDTRKKPPASRHVPESPIERPKVPPPPPPFTGVDTSRRFIGGVMIVDIYDDTNTSKAAPVPGPARRQESDSSVGSLQSISDTESDSEDSVLDRAQKDTRPAIIVTRHSEEEISSDSEVDLAKSDHGELDKVSEKVDEDTYGTVIEEKAIVEVSEGKQTEGNNNIVIPREGESEVIVKPTVDEVVSVEKYSYIESSKDSGSSKNSRDIPEVDPNSIVVYEFGEVLSFYSDVPERELRKYKSITEEAMSEEILLNKSHEMLDVFEDEKEPKSGPKPGEPDHVLEETGIFVTEHIITETPQPQRPPEDEPIATDETSEQQTSDEKHTEKEPSISSSKDSDISLKSDERIQGELDEVSNVLDDMEDDEESEKDLEIAMDDFRQEAISSSPPPELEPQIASEEDTLSDSTSSDPFSFLKDMPAQIPLPPGIRYEISSRDISPSLAKALELLREKYDLSEQRELLEDVHRRFDSSEFVELQSQDDAESLNAELETVMKEIQKMRESPLPKRVSPALSSTSSTTLVGEDVRSIGSEESGTLVGDYESRHIFSDTSEEEEEGDQTTQNMCFGMEGVYVQVITSKDGRIKKIKLVESKQRQESIEQLNAMEGRMYQNIPDIIDEVTEPSESESDDDDDDDDDSENSDSGEEYDCVERSTDAILEEDEEEEEEEEMWPEREQPQEYATEALETSPPKSLTQAPSPGEFEDQRFEEVYQTNVSQHGPLNDSIEELVDKMVEDAVSEAMVIESQHTLDSDRSEVFRTNDHGTVDREKTGKESTSVPGRHASQSSSPLVKQQMDPPETDGIPQKAVLEGILGSIGEYIMVSNNHSYLCIRG